MRIVVAYLAVASVLVSAGSPSSLAAQSTPSAARLIAKQASASVDANRDAAWLDSLARRRAPADEESFALAVATIDRLRYRYKQSDSVYASLQHASAADVRLQARFGAALGLAARSRWSDADSGLRGVLADARAAHDTSTEVDALLSASTVRGRIAGLRAALQAVDSARALLTTNTRDSSLVAALQCMDLRLRPPPTDTGLAHALDAAVSLARRHAGDRVVASCYLAAATSRIGSMSRLESGGWLESARTTALRANDRATSGAVMQWYGYRLFALGRLLNARDALADAIRDAEASGNESVLAWATMNAGQVLDAMGYRQRANEAYGRAASLMQATSDSAGLVTARGLRLALAVRNGAVDSIRPVLDAQLRFAERSGNHALAWSTYELDAYARAKSGDLVGALRSDSIMRARAVRANSVVGQDMSHRAAILLAFHRAAEALPLLRAHVARLSTRQPKERFVHRMRLALALAEADSTAASALEAAGASAEYDAWRASLPFEQYRALAFEFNTLFFGPDVVIPQLVAVLVEAKHTADALRVVESQRARTLVDALVRAQGDLPARVGLSADADRSARLPGTDSTTAIVYFVVGRDAMTPTTVIVHSANATVARAAPPMDRLLPLLRRWSALLEGGRPDSPLARQLGVALFGEVLDHLQPSVKQLVIIPDGAVQQLPLAALIVNGRRLGDRFAISSAPSYTALTLLHDRPVVARGLRAVLFADPTRAVRTVGGERLDPLPGAAREVSAIAALLPHATVRAGDRATRSALLDAPMDSYAIAHFAVHTLIDEETVDGSMLVLADDDAGGFVSTTELRRSTLAADLVVLSACRSLRGISLEGEGIRGLPITFLEMGAKAVVATLWDLPDGEAARMMLPFYRAVRAGATVSDALTAARREARQRGVSSRTWAAFVVLGDGSLRLPAP